MRRYLDSKGVKVPDKTSLGGTKNAGFSFKDSNGHSVDGKPQPPPPAHRRRKPVRFVQWHRILEKLVCHSERSEESNLILLTESSLDSSLRSE
jgi:hypothetical protein